MSEGEATPMPLAGPHTRCLLLVPRGYEAPLDLIEGLTRRRVTPQEVGDAPAVMVALATGATGGAFGVLVLVEPDVIRDADRLVEAVRKHHRVAVWQYRHDRDPRLIRVASPPQPPRQASPVRSPQADEAPKPRSAPVPSQSTSRTVIEPVAPPMADPLAPLAHGPEHGPLPTVLSDEELAMLLDDAGPRTGEPRNPRKGGDA